MMFGVVWNYKTPEGEVQKLMADPESLEGMDNPDAAKKEGRQLLTELAPEHRTAIMPAAIVEVSEDMITQLNSCPKIQLDALEDDVELDFVDVSKTDFWLNQGWWHK